MYYVMEHIELIPGGISDNYGSPFFSVSGKM